MKNNGDRRQFGQRTLCAVASILCLLIAGYLLWFSDQPNSSVAGILVKVGMMLGVLWLALPVILTGDFRLSLFPLAVLSGLLILMAARPRVFLVAAAIAVVALGINWLLRRVVQR